MLLDPKPMGGKTKQKRQLVKRHLGALRALGNRYLYPCVDPQRDP